MCFASLRYVQLCDLNLVQPGVSCVSVLCLSVSTTPNTEGREFKGIKPCIRTDESQKDESE